MLTTELGAGKFMPWSKKKRDALLSVAVTAGLAVAPLSMAAPANAWCAGLSGINIGTGCTSTFGNFSLGLGPTAVANSNGFLTGAIALGNAVADTTGILTAAWAGGSGASPSAAFTNGILSWAVAQGDGVVAQAGVGNTDLANVAFNFGNATAPFTSQVVTGNGGFNAAYNFGGNANTPPTGGVTTGNLSVEAGNGWGNNALNVIGNRDTIFAGNGFFNFATAIGNLLSFPNGSDSTATSVGNLGVAISYQPVLFTPACTAQPCGNVVTATGPLAISGAIAATGLTVNQTGIGTNINNIIKLPVAAVKVPATAVPATGTQTSLAASPSANTVSNSNLKSSQKSGNNQVTKSTSKTSAAVSKVTSKRAGKG
jgi:hypothetical protein